MRYFYEFFCFLWHTFLLPWPTSSTNKDMFLYTWQSELVRQLVIEGIFPADASFFFLWLSGDWQWAECKVMCAVMWKHSTRAQWNNDQMKSSKQISDSYSLLWIILIYWSWFSIQAEGWIGANGFFWREGNEASYLRQCGADTSMEEECKEEEQSSPLMEFWLRWMRVDND